MGPRFEWGVLKVSGISLALVQIIVFILPETFGDNIPSFGVRVHEFTILSLNTGL